MNSLFFLRKFLLFVGDLFLFFSALIIALFIGFGNNLSFQIFLAHLFPFLILLPFWLAFFNLVGGYDLKVLKNTLSLTSRVFAFFLFVLLSSVIFFYLFKSFGIAPKQNLVVFALSFCGSIFLWRKGSFSLFSSHFQQKVAIIGITKEAKVLVSVLKQNPQFGWKFEGFIPQPSLDQLPQKIKKFNLDTIILAKRLSLGQQSEKIFFKLLSFKVNILDLANAYELILKKIPVQFIDCTWFIENLKEGKKEFFDKTKRIIDIFFAFLILIITFPLWPLITLAVKLEDRGPVFYKQKRVGKNKKIFWLIKFRSMRKDAEKSGPIWAKEKDPRITKVGRFLRKTHLDELPQMINILKGELSLVGPRPERPEFVEKLEKQIPYYYLRHIIKPGFTGWAQIKFRYARSVIDSLEKFQYDLYYIKNRSFFLDLYILLKTFGLLFRG
jgi:exopolysaccharide biosynthesis polyprenyl glycosylphosphotransferase